MTALALVFLLAYSWEVLARTHIVLCETVINIIWMAFIVDYVVSILLAEDKKTWFKDNLLMLVSIALPVFRPLRLLRLVAVLNVLNRTGDMAGKKHRHRADDNRRGPDRHRHRDTGLMDSRSCP